MSSEPEVVARAIQQLAANDIRCEEVPVAFAKAPGRINLIGEHVDYVGGRVLPAAVPLTCDVVAFRGGKSAFTILAFAGEAVRGVSHKVEFTTLEELNQLRSQLPVQKSLDVFVIAALVEAVKLTPDLEGATSPLMSTQECIDRLRGTVLFCEGHVPLGAGLSSSACFCVGLLLTMISITARLPSELSLTPKDKLALTKAARRIENEYCGVQCGIMDQFASVHGAEDCFLEVDCDKLEFRRHNLSAVLGSEFQFLLVNSMNSHSLGEAYNVIRRSIEEGQSIVGREEFGNDKALFCSLVTLSLQDGEPSRVVDSLHRCLADGHLSEIQHRCSLYVVEEMIRTQTFIDLAEEAQHATVSRKHDIVSSLGDLLNATHRGLSTQLKVSTEELDFVQTYVTTHRLAVGCRLMGGGFGGCCLVLVHRDHVGELEAALPTAFCEKFGVVCSIYPIRKLAQGATVTAPLW